MGGDGGDGPKASVECIDTRRGAWEPHRAMPHPRRSHACAATTDGAHGGLFAQVYSHCVSSVGRHIVVAGGFELPTLEELSSCHVLDTMDAHWLKGPAMSVPRHSVGCAMVRLRARTIYCSCCSSLVV